MNNGNSSHIAEIGRHEHHLQEVLDSSEPLIYRIDFRSGRYEYISRAVARLFGVTHDHFLEHGVEVFRQCMHPDDWRRNARQFRALCKETPGRPVATEVSYRLTLADGREHHFLDRITLESDAQGELVDGYGVTTDVTGRVQAEQALRDSEQRFRELLGTLDELVWCYSVDEKRVIYVNDAVARIYGRPKEDFLADPDLWRRAIHPEDREMAKAADRLVAQQGRAECDCRIVDQSGEVHWLRFSLYCLRNETTGSARVVGVASDVTARKRAELAVMESESLFQTTMDAAQAGIFVLQDGVLVYVNPMVPRLYGYRSSEMLGMTPLDLTAPEMRDLVLEQMRRRAAGEPGKPYESVGLRKDGSTFPVMILGSPSSYRGRPASVGTVFDLSERKESEKRILELAFFDPLTGLANRRLLEDRFTQAVAEAECLHGRLAVLVVDLDHFKRVNDSLGHAVGDQLLCAVAGRFRKLLRKMDTAARLGGDEFVLVLPGLGADEAAETARRLLDVCAEPFMIGPHEMSISPSVGISLYPDDGGDFGALLKNADAAMYQAKEAGRRTFQFYAQNMNVATLERLLLENSLRQALSAGQFTLHYQPVVDMDSGRIVGCEALLRWQHPQLGMVPPGRFIPVAEDSNLIHPIGEWVLNESCRQAQAWRQAGLPPIRVAVNVSPVQFRQSHFVATVERALRESGLEPAYLELELTERTVMHDAESNLNTLHSLHRMGVELAVDDFGTGYSSLAYLKRFPVSKLKIDQSFVRDIEEDTDDLAIAATIISIGHSLRLAVQAEGVENVRQLHLLEARVCDVAQGYYFSLPVTADEFADLLARQPFEKVDGLWKKW